MPEPLWYPASGLSFTMLCVEQITGLEERVDNAGVHRVRFTRKVQQLDSFQEGWTEAVAPTTGEVQLQRTTVAAGGSTVQREKQVEAEQAKVTALLVKHGLQKFEAQLREHGATSPIHLAQLRKEDLHMFTLNHQHSVTV